MPPAKADWSSKWLTKKKPRRRRKPLPRPLRLLRSRCSRSSGCGRGSGSLKLRLQLKLRRLKRRLRPRLRSGAEAAAAGSAETAARGPWPAAAVADVAAAAAVAIAAAAIAAGVTIAVAAWRRDDGGEELIEKLVHINRVSKTVKGGKRFGFAALVVVGDGKGRAGFGHGKAREVPEAISKATAAAKKAMVRVPLRDGRTLHHDGNGHFGAGKVTVRSAPSGTGIIAGGPMRAVFESLGVADVVTKSVGTSNPYNMIRATFEALKEQTSPRSVAQRRGKKVSDLLGRGGMPGRRSRSGCRSDRGVSIDGQDQDHPDRIADPARQDPARDACRPRPQQDAPHGRSRRHARSDGPSAQGAHLVSVEG